MSKLKAKRVHKEDSIMNKLLENKVIDITQLIPGELVEGVVVAITNGEMLVDVGAKSEGIISSSDLQSADDSYKNLKPGDTILAVVLQAENDQGYIVLSTKKAEKERNWRVIEDAIASGNILEALVIEYNKGGLLVDCLGLRGFVPLSHLDRVHFANDMAKYASGSEAELKESLKGLAGTHLKVKVIEFNKTKNRLVLSEKEATGNYSIEVKEEKLSKVKTGSTVEGIVTGIMPFGVFVDCNGIEGLVHISEIAWEKVNTPTDYFKVGETISVKVLGIDDKSKKLALSVKQLSNNPWETAEKNYPIGTKITGVVSKVVPFGAFVTIEKGLDGLIHVSETNGPLKEGDKVEAIVTLVDKDNQKLALSVKQLES